MPDTIDRTTGEVVALPEPMNSPEIGKIAEALAKAQGQFSNPQRNRDVAVKTTSGGSYTFSYATFDAILSAIREPLAVNGLSFTQTLIEHTGRYRLRTTLMHSSGQWLASDTPLFIQGQGNQAFGSALSYMKRYALCAMLGVAADEDDDGNAADGNSAEKKDRAPSPKPNGTRKLAPKASEETEFWKRLANEIKAAIDEAPTLKALNDEMQIRGETWGEEGPKEGSDLFAIRKASEEAYRFLSDRANKRRHILAQAPSQAA